MWLTARQFDAADPGSTQDSAEPEYLTAPALDPAYDFQVAVYCARRNERRGRLSWTFTEKRDLSRLAGIARSTIRQTTKAFSILEPAAAEQAINERLDIRLDDAYRKERMLVCRWEARAEVTLPDEVLDLMRGAFKGEHQIRANARATELRMTKTDELRQQWDRFLDDAARSQNAQHPVRLAENPDDIAGTLEEVLRGRRERAGDLLTLLDKIVEVQRSADILDLVVRSESVLRKTLEMMGIELPEVEGDALLASLSDDI